MTSDSLPRAAELLRRFLGEDEYYLASSRTYGDAGEPALRAALQLFLDRAELGFVWLADDAETTVGVCVVCFGISTSRGGLVAKLDDVFVMPGHQNQGIGSQMLSALAKELEARGATRIDTSVHFRNLPAKRFYERNGFRTLDEERLSCVIADGKDRGTQTRVEHESFLPAVCTQGA